MNRWITATGIGITGVLVAVLTARSSGEPARPAVPPSPAAHPAPEPVIVHEWGTFTGLAASNGVHIPFTTNIGGDLPAFVLNRQRQQEFHEDAQFHQVMVFVKWGGAVALQRMETPVLYFYSKQTQEIRVRVDFPRGTLSEFYPPVKEMAPPFGTAIGEPRVGARRAKALAVLDSLIAGTGTRKVMEEAMTAHASTESFLDWGRVQVLAQPSAEQAKLVPAVVDQKQHYDLARETDANLVQITDPKGTKHVEKFLFYRGLGNFTLPITLAARGHDQFEIRNAGATPISAAFLLHSDANGQVRFTSVGGVVGKHSVVLSTGVQSQRELAEAMVQSLIGEGLYEKEARAMVRTWQANWLAEPGTRLLYIVPRPVTDALLPLQIEPAPKEAVRVLVGRIDVLTPEVESQLGSALTRVAARGPEGLTQQEAQDFDNMGRFLWPALKHVAEANGAGDKTTQLAQSVFIAVSLRKPADVSTIIAAPK